MDNQNSPNDINSVNPTPTEPINTAPQSTQTVEELNSQQQQTFQPANQQIAEQQFEGSYPGRGLGIASLVTAILGLSIIALILGIVALIKTKKANHPTNIFALIGIIWSIISIIIVFLILISVIFNNNQAVQTRADDTVTKTEINTLYQKLEEYANTNNSYPLNFTAETFPGIDSSALTDNNGETFKFSDGSVKTLADAESQSLPTVDQMYQYLAYDCAGNECGGYVIRAYIENGANNLYTQYSLNNF